MTAEQQAIQLATEFAGLDNESFITNASKRQAELCVEKIIEALKITTGHCELRRLDAQEVAHDLKYWNDVKRSIDNL